MARIIHRDLLETLSGEAKITERKRKNFNFHLSFDDPINRMLNALEMDSYVQAHKHEKPDKREVFILLKGKLAVVFFDAKGVVTESVILDGETNFGVEIPPAQWHTIFALENGTVIYEIKDGPYSAADDKNFAPWAPKEGEAGCTNYMLKLRQELNLKI